MEHTSASKRCKSSRVRFEEGKGERETSQKMSEDVSSVVTVPWHRDPIQGNITPLLHAVGEPWDIFLGRSRCTLTSYSAVVLHSHISGRPNIFEGLHHPLGAQRPLSPVMGSHLPSCDGCSRYD